jgi:hypothetical protein
MALKKDKAKKKKAKPRAKKRMTGLVVLDGKRQIDRRTGLNRDIPPMTMGGGGGSPNLLQALAMRPAITGQGGFSIQTPDQFKQAQDISTIAEEVKKQGRISIGEPTKLPGKVIDLTDVEALKKSSMKMEPVMQTTPMKEEGPLRKQEQRQQEFKARTEVNVRKLTETLMQRDKARSAGGTPATPEQQEWFGAKSAGGAGPRQWDGGGHVAGLPSASVQTSIAGVAVDAMGSPQPDTY